MTFGTILGICFLLTNVGASTKSRLGDFHTSTAFIEKLVEAENGVVDLLSSYLPGNNAPPVVTRYIQDWKSWAPELYVENPLASYQLFKRIVYNFPQVEQAIAQNITLQEGLKSLKNGTPNLPSELDVNGVAWAIVRLQDVYNLPIDDLIRGVIKWSYGTKGLDADDCFRFGEESFKNLAFDLSQKWSEKGIQILQKDCSVSKKHQKKIKDYEELMEKRNVMKDFIISITKETDIRTYEEFSGLGIPKSFTKSICANHKEFEDVQNLEQTYNALCRGEQLKTPKQTATLRCQYTSWGSNKALEVFKSERLFADPEISIYRDVISDEEIRVLQKLAIPVMKIGRVKSYANKRKHGSIARIGKSAYLHKDEYPLVQQLMKRVEAITGLTTRYATDLHVFNYGVGGLYDLHVDYFDFSNREGLSYSYGFMGDQLATILFYLSDVEVGGCTAFPFLGMAVTPQKGSMAVWYNLHRSGAGNFLTMHSSCPVLLGQKWIATLWLYEKGHDIQRPCLLDKNK